jgi:hypothetical protein
MENKKLLEKMLQNLNEDGLSLLLDLLGNMDSKERYNKNTTPERLLELKKIAKQKDEQREAELEVNRLREQREMEERLASEKAEYQELINRNKKFLDEIKNVNVKLNIKQIDAIYAKNNRDIYKIMIDCFKAGFIKGQRAESARVKKEKVA